MSNSDSEDLEFESADEDQKDLSDLDIDEILNESDEQPKNKPEKSQQQPKGSNQQQTSEEKTAPKVEESSKSAVETVSKALENLETNEKNSKPDSPPSNKDLIKPDEEVKEEFEEKKEVEEKKKEETKEQPKKEEASAWDESNLSDLDDNEEEKSEVKLEETKQAKPEEKKQTKSEEKKPAATETGWNSGWDDLEFTDIDNKKEDDAKTTPVKTAQVEPKKVAIEEKKVVQQNISQPQKQPQQQEQSSGWSWGKLGTNLLSSAATITMQMMETVEASLGAPDPHELAARIAKSDEGQEEKTTAKEEHSKDENKPQSQANKDDWKFDNNDSDWFSINKIASTGTNLITGSLDVLESVGKKTFEMINDKDPNFKQTRELLKKVPINTAKPNLSQLLREAQSQNESSSASQMTSSSSQSSINNSKSSPKAVERSSKQEKLSFSLFFDEYKGTAHLEALEMLSSQAKVKLELLDMEKPISRYSKAVKTELERIKRLFDEKRLNNDEDDEEEDEEDEEIRRELEGLTDETKKALDLSRVEALARQFSSRSSLIANIDKMIAAFRTASLASREDALSPSELFNESIKCFALITSNMIELFHKAAETVFVEIENSKTKIKREKIFEDIDCLYRITKLAIKAVTVLSNDYSKSCKINAKQLNESNPNHIITDIYLEASNSCVFIGDAYLLFLPMFKYLLLRTEND